MKSFCKLLLLAIAAIAPAKVFACAACGSGSTQMIDSSMVDGMNLGILTLLCVLGIVLVTALSLLIYFIRKSEALNAIAEQSNSPEAIKA